MLQETLPAAWRGLEGFERRASLRAWLYRIATNRCLNARRDSARRRPPPEPPFHPPEPTRWSDPGGLEPYPDALLNEIADAAPGHDAHYETKEAIELAFIAAVQQLPPRQRAALVLRDVLGYSTSEVAAMLDVSEAAVKGALRRARVTLVHRDPAAGREHAPRATSEWALGQRFADAFAIDDVDGVIALLTDDAWLRMPPAPHEYHGAAAIGAFLAASARHRAGRRFHLVPTRANTQPAFALYLTHRRAPTPYAAGLIVLTVAGDRITAITRFLDTSLPRHFGLAAVLGDQ